MPFSACHDGERPEAWGGICAENLREGRLRKLSVGGLGENSYTGSGAHEAVERVRVGTDLFGEIVGGFGSRLDEVGDAEQGEAGDGASDVSAIYNLKNAGVSGLSLGLSGHSSFTWNQI
jgi:hypothetical protein